MQICFGTQSAACYLFQQVDRLGEGVSPRGKEWNYDEVEKPHLVGSMAYAEKWAPTTKFAKSTNDVPDKSRALPIAT
jgi:hypothetical protein